MTTNPTTAPRLPVLGLAFALACTGTVPTTKDTVDAPPTDAPTTTIPDTIGPTGETGFPDWWSDTGYTR